VSAVLFAGVALTAARADDIKSGPDKRIAGAFDVKAITGANKGKTLCYV
jgi:hypothetical protein